MRARIGWVANLVRKSLDKWNTSAKKTISPARLTVEALEDRLALSANLPSVPPVNGINLLVPGDAFVLAGGVAPTDYTAITKWNQPSGLGSTITITYSFSNLRDGRIGLASSTVKATIQEALSRWAAVAPIRFVEVPDSGPAPSTSDYNQGSGAMLRFGHLSIDGAGRTLAYGYYPGGSGLAGDILFDDGEGWSTNPNSGHDLLEVATHEIGHTLGLGHEVSNTAIMNPYYATAFLSALVFWIWPAFLYRSLDAHWLTVLVFTAAIFLGAGRLATEIHLRFIAPKDPPKAAPFEHCHHLRRHRRGGRIDPVCI